jgi:hypothetical protein
MGNPFDWNFLRAAPHPAAWIANAGLSAYGALGEQFQINKAQAERPVIAPPIILPPPGGYQYNYQPGSQAAGDDYLQLPGSPSDIGGIVGFPKQGPGLATIAIAVVAIAVIAGVIYFVAIR